MQTAEISITKLTAKSLAKVLESIIKRSEAKATYSETNISYRESLKCLIKTLKEIN